MNDKKKQFQEQLKKAKKDYFVFVRVINTIILEKLTKKI